MKRQILESEQKALEINLDDGIYGTFAEIGAGQEVARHFFQAGAAAGTIAKTMSAYDKVYSDRIYGPEPSGRYVCESRLYRMLDHEYDLMEERLNRERPESCFFAFADTVSAINYTRTIKGSGWLGLRFQLDPESQPNDIIVQVRMLDNSNGLQQQAIGILGVNLIYAAFRYHNDPEIMVCSLMDNLDGRIKIDLVRITGPDFERLDNRLLSLWLIKHNMTEVSMFGPDKRGVHASEFLYKKHVLVVRGSYRPATLVNEDMLKQSTLQFKNEPDVDLKKMYILSEITLDNLMADGPLDEKDFLDRSDILCQMGQTVIVSNCEEHHKLINYLGNYKVQKLGLAIGSKVLLDIFNDKYYENVDGSLLSVFGELFTSKVKMYVYPAMQEGSAELMTSGNLPIPEEIQFIYQHLVNNEQIVDIENYNEDILHIYSKQVLEMIKTDEAGWEKMVSPPIAKLIKESCLFEFPYEQVEFEY